MLYLLLHDDRDMVKECLPEVWAIIFSMACRDDGNTAIALSRLINTYSKPYQSTTLTNCDQITAFETTILLLPPKFFHCPDPMIYVYTADKYAEDLDDTNEESAERLQSCSKELRRSVRMLTKEEQTLDQIEATPPCPSLIVTVSTS